MYTNSYDPNNGAILASKDQGATWTASALPFKVGGNMPGRGMGEVLQRILCHGRLTQLLLASRHRPPP